MDESIADEFPGSLSDWSRAYESGTGESAEESGEEEQGRRRRGGSDGAMSSDEKTWKAKRQGEDEYEEEEKSTTDGSDTHEQLFFSCVSSSEESSPENLLRNWLRRIRSRPLHGGGKRRVASSGEEEAMEQGAECRSPRLRRKKSQSQERGVGEEAGDAKEEAAAADQASEHRS